MHFVWKKQKGRRRVSVHMVNIGLWRVVAIEQAPRRRRAARI